MAGKLFGMAWALVGFTIVAIFTATVTTIISFAEPTPPGIRGRRIGVIKGSIERHLVLQEGGTPIGMFQLFLYIKLRNTSIIIFLIIVCM